MTNHPEGVLTTCMQHTLNECNIGLVCEAAACAVRTGQGRAVQCSGCTNRSRLRMCLRGAACSPCAQSFRLRVAGWDSLERFTSRSLFGKPRCLCVPQVGDYVLSPDIVVERKALPDLFASLGSGRLYNQVRRPIIHQRTTAACSACVSICCMATWRCVTLRQCAPAHAGSHSHVCAVRLL